MLPHRGCPACSPVKTLMAKSQQRSVDAAPLNELGDMISVVHNKDLTPAC